MNGSLVKNWRCFRVPRSGTLSFSYARQGCRSYLAVAGGFDAAPALGSRSTYVRASLGGYAGRALKAGDVLALKTLQGRGCSGKTLPDQYIPEYHSDLVLRVLLGPQDDLFLPEGIETFLSASYVITNRNDRMGYVLRGPAVKHCTGADIVSDALIPGSVQVPGDGMPIVMMVDCQTTGGYAKMATVIRLDLGLLAQGKTGDRVRFVRCSEAEAVEALREEQKRYREMGELLQG